MPEIQALKDRMERIDEHMARMKVDSGKLDKILTCLVGNEVSGTQSGLVAKVEVIKLRQESIERRLDRHDHTLDQMVWFVKIIIPILVTALIGLIIKLAFKL